MYHSHTVLWGKRLAICFFIGMLLAAGWSSGSKSSFALERDMELLDQDKQAASNKKRSADGPWAAFVRQGQLWINIAGKETRLIRESTVSRPRWSHDGSQIAYTLHDKECWVYQLHTKRALKLSDDARSYQWSPTKNVLAVQEGKLLNLYDGTSNGDSVQLKPVISGVGNYSWQPGGERFLVSSQAALLPSGWTQVQLYSVPEDAKMDSGKVQLLYTLPAQEDDFFAVGTSIFKWSPDQEWVAFYAVPTASLSADGNTLCMLSRDGKRFYTLNMMLKEPNWFQWSRAKTPLQLANIAGGGRMTVENKHLVVNTAPASQGKNNTPEGYADRDLAWVDDSRIVVSRSKETEWSEDESKRPLPRLVIQNMDGPMSHALTSPPSGWGDFYPYVDDAWDRLTWVRTDRKQAQVWESEVAGTHHRLMIRQLDVPESYYERWDWSEVLDWHST